MSDSIGSRRKTLRIIAFGIACIILLLVTYVMASNYVNREIYVRDAKIRELNNQVSNLQELLEENKPQILDLNRQIANLTDTVNTLKLENEELNELTQYKQYQLSLAWHEIYVLRNQTAKLEAQITELETQIEDLQATTAPTGTP